MKFFFITTGNGGQALALPDPVPDDPAVPVGIEAVPVFLEFFTASHRETEAVLFLVGRGYRAFQFGIVLFYYIADFV